MPWYAYVVVALIGAAVGTGELISRYTDEPQDAIRSVPALIYLSVNAIAALFALLVVSALGWTFGADEGLLRLILQICAAGFAAMSVLRSAVFTLRVGDSDFHAGPVALVMTILQAADQAVDRRRGARRSQVAKDIMAGVDFDKAKEKLPARCWSLLQNVPADKQNATMDAIKKLNADKRLGDTRAENLALTLMNVVGEKVLREAAANLDDEIRLHPR